MARLVPDIGNADPMAAGLLVECRGQTPEALEVPALVAGAVSVQLQAPQSGGLACLRPTAAPAAGSVVMTALDPQLAVFCC